MITKVKKRDGRIVDYDSSKIVNAILKAFKSLGMLEAPQQEQQPEHTNKVLQTGLEVSISKSLISIPNLHGCRFQVV